MDRSGFSCSSLFVSTLAVAFIILKLTGYIDWPWIWVLSPIWITMLLSVVILLIVIAVYLILNR